MFTIYLSEVIYWSNIYAFKPWVMKFDRFKFCEFCANLSLSPNDSVRVIVIWLWRDLSRDCSWMIGFVQMLMYGICFLFCSVREFLAFSRHVCLDLMVAMCLYLPCNLKYELWWWCWDIMKPCQWFCRWLKIRSFPFKLALLNIAQFCSLILSASFYHANFCCFPRVVGVVDSLTRCFSNQNKRQND